MPEGRQYPGGVFDHHRAPSGEPADEADRLDRALEDRDWTLWPAGVERRVFATPSGDLAGVEAGPRDGERFLLVPGVTGSKEDFALVIPVLAEAGFRVQSLDLAGQFESGSAGAPPGERLTLEHVVADLAAVLDDGPPAHLLGYSFAGLVAQVVAVRRPDRVRSLALLATPPDPGDAFRSVRGIGPLSPLLPPAVGARLMRWGIESNRNHVPPQRLAFVRHRFAFTDPGSVRDIIRIMKHAPDLRDAVAALPVPKLVAVGAGDLWAPERHAAFAERLGARLAVYPTGHSPCETTPHQLARDLRALAAEAGRLGAAGA